MIAPVAPWLPATVAPIDDAGIVVPVVPVDGAETEIVGVTFDVTIWVSVIPETPHEVEVLLLPESPANEAYHQ